MIDRSNSQITRTSLVLFHIALAHLLEAIRLEESVDDPFGIAAVIKPSVQELEFIQDQIVEGNL